MHHSSFSKQHSRSGIALVLVLSILILLTAVVVAFFTNATTDLTASKGYSDEVRVKLLGQSAVNLVVGQIQAATQGGTAGNPQAWASQPGMIRAYDTTGNLVTAYRLYSSDVLQEAPGADLSNAGLAKEIPARWDTFPSDYVDLNSPTIISDSSVTKKDDTSTNAGVGYSARFPIIDGNYLKAINGGVTYDQFPAQTGPGPGGDNIPDIEGFSVQGPPLSSIYDAQKPIAPNNNPVPMPVRWLYVLQNGELHARDAKGNLNSTIPNNPPVGRIAFWTDDDTCKLNINTASEGQNWSPPRGVNRPEFTVIGRNFPAQNEFQMFSGHPAKTCLSTVFGAILPVPQTLSNGNYLTTLLDVNGYTQFLLPYYDLTPRVTEGMSYGSGGGTKAVAASGTGIPYDADRLYTSVDELMFKTQANGATPVRVTRNISWTANGGGTGNPIKPSFLETARFFLTASNRAPEVTLLNTPRISLWPLPAQTNLLSGKERLLAFCGTIPSTTQNGVTTGYPYYFQRSTGSFAGYQINASSDSTSLDFTATNVKRNPQLYTYLQQEMQADVPGLGPSFAKKYPATYRQISTEIVDQIRSGMNTWPTDNGSGQYYNYTQGRVNSGEGQVTPLLAPPPPAQDNTPFGNTKGFGRYSTITEVALDLFRVDDPNVNKGPIQIGAVLMLQPFNPSPGFPTWSPDMQVTVQGLDNLTIYPSIPAVVEKPMEVGLGFNLSSGDNGTNIIDSVVGLTCVGNPTEYNTIATTFTTGFNTAKTLPPAGPPASPDNRYYPFFNVPTSNGAAIDPKNVDPKTGIMPGKVYGQLPAGTTNFDLNARGTQTITVKIYANPVGGNAATHGTLIQTLNMAFPSAGGLPVPKYNAGNPKSQNQSPSGPTGVQNIFNSRLAGNGGFAADGSTNDPTGDGAGTGLIGRADVVRSVIVDPEGPSMGDLRVIAGLKTVPYNGSLLHNYFGPHPFYNYSGSSNPGTPLLDPNPAQHADNWRFAESLKIGADPGWGEPGYYIYSNATAYVNGAASGTPVRKSAFTGNLVAHLPKTGNPYSPEASPAVPAGLTGAYITLPGPQQQQIAGDWDTGPGSMEDGPYINKPDEGNASNNNGGTPGYYMRITGATDQGGSYSPNREVSSGVIFGSLPTGIDPTVANSSTAVTRPWQTLLFCANPAGNDDAPGLHPGFGISKKNSPSGVPVPPYTTIPDHYILDLFTMPIVEPYAISEPLSTQGKVNMNYQIAPFTYIHRSTGVRAVLKSTRMLAIPSTTNGFQHYKISPSLGLDPYQFRYDINPDEKTGTLKAFEDRFDSGDIFRSASEICTVPLVPAPIPSSLPGYDPGVTQGVSATTLATFWKTNQLTGDNLREEPYGDIYARMTTKSNTYTVHVRVQTLKKLTTDSSTFIDPTDPVAGTTKSGPPRDQITAEYRGSYQIERYVDPNITINSGDPTKDFPDYATNLNGALPISKFYKFHTIGAKQF